MPLSLEIQSISNNYCRIQFYTEFYWQQCCRSFKDFRTHWRSLGDFYFSRNLRNDYFALNFYSRQMRVGINKLDGSNTLTFKYKLVYQCTQLNSFIFDEHNPLT